MEEETISLTSLRHVILIKTFKTQLGFPSLQFLARFAINLTAIPLNPELPLVFELQVFQILRKTFNITTVKIWDCPLWVKTAWLKPGIFEDNKKRFGEKLSERFFFFFNFHFSTTSPIPHRCRRQGGTKASKSTSTAISQILVHTLHCWEFWAKIKLTKTYET